MSASITLDPVSGIFAAMRSHTINGVPLSDVVGGGDPQAIASEIFAALQAHGGLARTAAVLDVGCGCGRIAAALTQYLSPGGRYVGVDIVSGLIGFAREFIGAPNPNFHFLLLNDRNETYEAWRGVNDVFDLARLEDAAAPEFFDFVICVSLFTHLDYPAACEMLASVATLLKRGGRGFITFFVLNEQTAERMKCGQTGFTFQHTTGSGKLYAEQKVDPTFAVAYEEELLQELISSAGLQIVRQLPGYWSTGVPGETFQDAVIIGKPD